MKTAVSQRDERIHREQELAFEIDLQTGRQRNSLNALGEGDGRRAGGDGRGRERVGLHTDLAPAEYLSTEHVDEQRGLRRRLEFEPGGVLQLVSGGDAAVLRVVRRHADALAPELIADVP